MALLNTLEGDVCSATDADTLDRLFNCNDTLGVLIYGVDNWNKLKSYAANLALKLLMAKRGRLGKDNRSYKSRNDILDKAFGFNDALGATLLGGEEWRHFTNRCKMAAPCLGSSFLDRWVVSPAKNFVNSLTPKDASSPLSWAKYITGVEGIEHVLQNVKDMTGYTDREKAEKKKKQEEEYAKRLIQQQLDADEREKVRASEVEKAAKESEAKANADANYKIKTDPEYLAARNKSFLIWGALGVATLYVVLNSGKRG